jgi:hypothetical protein
MAGSLELTKFVEVSSATANVDVTDCFNDKFDVYKITFSDATSSFDGSSNNVRFINSSGSVISSSNYDFAYLRLRADSSYNELQGTSQDKLLEAGGILPNTEGVGTVLYVFNPFSSSNFTFVIMQMSSMSGTQDRNYKYIGLLKDTSSITGIRFINADGNTTSAKISVYGVK